MLEKSFSYSSNISWVKIENEVFVFNEISKDVYLFKNKERKVWDLIKCNLSKECLFALMEKESVASEEVLQILDMFYKNGLIEK